MKILFERKIKIIATCMFDAFVSQLMICCTFLGNFIIRFL